MNVQNNFITTSAYHASQVDQSPSPADMPTTAVKVDNLQNVLKPAQGSVKYADGSFYLGDLLHNEPDGQGRVFGADGKVLYEGGFKLGKYHGVGYQYLDGMLVKQGVYRQGQLTDDESESTCIDKTTKTPDVTGGETLQYTDGSTYKGQLQNNEPNGYGRLYNQDATLRYEGYFKQGKFHGDGKYYCNGILYQEGKYQEGRLEGAGLQYNEFGQLSYQGNFQKGRPHGYGKSYISGRHLHSEGIYSEGKSHGYTKIYDLQNKLKAEGIYNNNTRQGEWTYYADGKVIKIDASEMEKKKWLYW